MLDGLAKDSNIPTQVLNVLKQPSTVLLESLYTMFDLVMSSFPAEKVLKVEEN